MNTLSIFILIILILGIFYKQILLIVILPFHLVKKRKQTKERREREAREQSRKAEEEQKRAEEKVRDEIRKQVSKRTEDCNKGNHEWIDTYETIYDDSQFCSTSFTANIYDYSKPIIQCDHCGVCKAKLFVV